MIKPREEPHIVKEFMVGHTRIRIADNCCRNMTKEDVQRVLREIAATAQAHITAAAMRKEAEEKEAEKKRREATAS